MVRLTHISGSLQGTASSSPKAVIRIGRGADCDVRFDAQRDTKVSTHHAEIRFDGGNYFLIDTGSSNGTLVNGKKIAKHKLREGDSLVFGAGGPEAKFEIDNNASAGRAPAAYGQPPMGNGGQASGYGEPPMAPGYGQPPMAPPRRATAPKLSAHDDAKMLGAEAQQKISMARAMTGGQPSGQTMFIMADTLQKVQASTQMRSGKRWGKVVLTLLAIGMVVTGTMGYVIWDQKQQLLAITQKKESADKQIQKIQLAMQIETDPEKLQSLDDQLTLLTGKAQQAIGEMEKKDKTKGEELANEGDDLDREIRAILKKFGADTYAIPPIFKERLKFYLDKRGHAPQTRVVWKRRQQYWPMIIKEFSALGIPEEMAYVAWQESQFDPFITSPVGARGMWQLMPATARAYGLRVDENWKTGGYDERTDVVKSTRAGSKYLYNLLTEFGSDSFMLAIASYNKGEGGMRKVLHDVGFRKDQRDFWHLYRLKKLPDETMEYVPQILAWAIIGTNPHKYGLE